MVKLIKRRSLGTLVAIVILVLLLCAAGLMGWLSIRSRSVPHSSGAAGQTAPVPVTTLPPGSHSVSVQLAAQDLTPASHLGLAAAGFLAREQLTLTVADAEGHTYDMGTLAAGADGRVRAVSLAPPAGLASGAYQLVVVGGTSHRQASVTFRMHDTPPIVALDTYTSAPGQPVGFAGAGFFAGEVVDVYLGPSKAPLASVTATDLGAVSGRLSVPALPAGTYTLTVIGKQSQTATSMGFSVQGFSAWVVLDRYALKPGQTVGFMGHGFAPSEQVFVYLNSLKADPVMRLTADTSGRVVAQDTWIPSGAPGDNALTLVGQSSKATATATFTILPSAEPTPTPSAP